MNHYECLKVTPDAPTEVIRAAYRALAGKRHPDRQGGGAAGSNDEGHKEMVAINAAYEVLINPELRAEYDSALAAAKARPRPGRTASANESRAKAALEVAERETGFSETRVDIDWLSPKRSGPVPLWPLTGLRKYLAIALGVVLLIAIIWTAWQIAVRHQMDKALSDQYAAHPTDPLADDPAAADAALPPPALPTSSAHAKALARADALLEDWPPQDAASTPRAPTQATPGTPPASASGQAPTSVDHLPTVTELARMSDEQLMAVLPALGELQPAKGSFSRQVARAHHPLDGKPLNLRSDTQLIDPLAQP